MIAGKVGSRVRISKSLIQIPKDRPVAEFEVRMCDCPRGEKLAGKIQCRQTGGGETILQGLDA